MKLIHHLTCTAKYPEKLTGEPPQHITETDIGDGEIVLQCVDCGAFVTARRPIQLEFDFERDINANNE